MNIIFGISIIKSVADIEMGSIGTDYRVLRPVVLQMWRVKCPFKYFDRTKCYVDLSQTQIHRKFQRSTVCRTRSRSGLCGRWWRWRGRRWRVLFPFIILIWFCIISQCESNETVYSDELEAADEGDEEDGTGSDAPSVASSETSAAATSTAPGTSTTANGKSSGNRRKGKNTSRNRKKRKGGKGGPGSGKNTKEDKEWAKYVFVQQLRLQQQHNDEMNRVKTLWKKERQDRVEMHKKVLKQLKALKKEIEQQAVAIERLTV